MSKEKITNEELFTQYIAGDKSAMKKMYLQNEGLVISRCKAAYEDCHSPEPADFDELNQEAALSFLISAPEYDPAKGTMFSTFIGKCIYNHMIDYISKQINKENNEKVIYGKTSYVPDMDSENRYKAETNLVEQDYIQLKSGVFNISAERAYFRILFLEIMKNALDLLNPRQIKFVSYHFGFGGDDEEYYSCHTLTETAYHFHLTESEARKIRKSALKTMRKYCHENMSFIAGSEEDDESAGLSDDTYAESFDETDWNDFESNFGFEDESELCEFDFDDEYYDDEENYDYWS